MAEGEQPGHPEQQVVGQGHRGHHPCQREQVQGAGRVGGAGQDAGDGDVQQGQAGQQHDQAEGQEQPGQRGAVPGRGGRAGHAATFFPRSPEGRVSTTTASSTTTAKSP
ncbi:hypothetical protein [Ornithinimicrobium kibberense]|uniref:hypothetical protein n=1 Tax=Ornithinimicrobium kibberense TaxID=282060 RepID=UPI0036108E23